MPQSSIVARPLTDLLRKKQRWQWCQVQEYAFASLKQMLANDAVVSLPDLNRPFVVETDASGVGIAAALLQEGPERLKPVSFISRVLTDSERNYTVQEWECLAVVWAVDKFRPYLDFTDFDVHFDHSSLSWMFTTEQASPRVRRWVLRLQGFSCTIRHRRGHANIPADALSRAPLHLTETPALSLPETLFPIAAPDGEPRIIFEGAATPLVIDDIGILRDKGRLADEQAQDPMLAALNPDESTNARTRISLLSRWATTIPPVHMQGSSKRSNEFQGVLCGLK